MTNINNQDPKELELQYQFLRTICINFKQWCKDNNTNLTAKLNTPGKVNRSSIANIISGKKRYIPLLAVAYITSLTDLTIEELANYKRGKLQTHKKDS